MSDPFRYYLRVRYGECDAQKVVFNARYGEYVELAVTEYLRALGFDEEVASGALDYQLVRQTIEWRAPARFDDVIECRVFPQKLGNTSFVLSVEFRRARDQVELAKAETVYVMVDAQLQKRVLPEAFRTALSSGGQGRVIDHAAYLPSRR